jgi:hypothetical protein
MNTPAGAVLKRYTFMIGALCLLAGTWMCVLRPERAWAWLLAMLLLPVAWLVQVRRDAQRAAARDFQLSLALAGSLLALSLLTALGARLGWLESTHGWPERIWGVLMGTIILVFANAIPKQAASARRQATLRIVGRALVLGGLAYAVAWLVAPRAYALAIATGCLLLATVYALVRAGRDCWFRSAASPPPLT